MDSYFHQEFRRYLLFFPMWSNICNYSLTIISIPLTNSQAEVHFHFKKSDKDANNMPLTQYIERSNCFRLSVRRQFVDRLCETSHKDKQSAAIKRSITKLQSIFNIKDKHTADEVNSGNSDWTDENI